MRELIKAVLLECLFNEWYNRFGVFEKGTKEDFVPMMRQRIKGYERHYGAYELSWIFS